MGTSPVSPATPVAWLPSLTWLQRHERLILGTMVLAVTMFLGNRWLDKSAADATRQAAAAATVAAQAEASKKQADATFAQVLQQANQQTALLQAQVASDKQMIASLVQSIASRDAASSNRVTSVSGTKTPPQAVADLSSAYPLVKPIVPTDTGANVPTEDLQQFTIAKIEGDTAKADLKDTQAELSAAQAEVAGDENIIVEKDRVIAQASSTLLAHDTAAKVEAKKSADELKAVKAEARKSKWHWFLAGLAAGWFGHTAAAAHGL